MSRSRFAIALALTFLVAGCNTNGVDSQKIARVSIGTGLGSKAEITPMGVPTDPSDNTPGVTEAVLTVFRDDVQVFFDANGDEADPGPGVELILSGDVTQQLNLLYGTYDFVIVAQDDDGNPLADGLMEDYAVEGDVEVLVPLVSRIDAADFSAPTMVMPNEIFDVLLNVRPPVRSDLVVPTTDFDASYDYDAGLEIGSSDLGIRISAGCEDVNIDAYIYRPDDTNLLVTAQTTVPVGFLCPTGAGAIGVDLVPPFIDVDSHTTGQQVSVSSTVSVDLFGSVNDSESDTVTVQVYEGVVLVGTAAVAPAVDPEPMGTWELTGEFFADVARTYDMMVVAIDEAGNETRVPFQLIAVEN